MKTPADLPAQAQNRLVLLGIAAAVAMAGAYAYYQQQPASQASSPKQPDGKPQCAG